MDEVKALLDLGVARKRQQNFQGAKRAYCEAKAIDPTNVLVYYALGKLCYLMEERQEAIVNYLIAAHLAVQNTAITLETDSPMAVALRLQLQQLPPQIELVQASVHPFAAFAFLDTNTPRHLAHALIDLDDAVEKSPGVYEFIHLYRLGLLGKMDITEAAYQLELKSYRPVGVWFIVDNLRWDQIKNRRADSLYSKSQCYVYKALELFDQEQFGY